MKSIIERAVDQLPSQSKLSGDHCSFCGDDGLQCNYCGQLSEIEKAGTQEMVIRWFNDVLTASSGDFHRIRKQRVAWLHGAAAQASFFNLELGVELYYLVDLMWEIEAQKND